MVCVLNQLIYALTFDPQRNALLETFFCLTTLTLKIPKFIKSWKNHQYYTCLEDCLKKVAGVVGCYKSACQEEKSQPYIFLGGPMAMVYLTENGTMYCHVTTHSMSPYSYTFIAATIDVVIGIILRLLLLLLLQLLLLL